MHVCAPKNRSPKYMKQQLTELKAEIENSVIVVGDLNTAFSITDRITTKNISRNTEDFKKTIN